MRFVSESWLPEPKGSCKLLICRYFVEKDALRKVAAINCDWLRCPRIGYESSGNVAIASNIILQRNVFRKNIVYFVFNLSPDSRNVIISPSINLKIGFVVVININKLSVTQWFLHS